MWSNFSFISFLYCSCSVFVVSLNRPYFISSAKLKSKRTVTEQKSNFMTRIL